MFFITDFLPENKTVIDNKSLYLQTYTATICDITDFCVLLKSKSMLLKKRHCSYVLLAIVVLINIIEMNIIDISRKYIRFFSIHLFSFAIYIINDCITLSTIFFISNTMSKIFLEIIII